MLKSVAVAAAFSSLLLASTFSFTGCADDVDEAFDCAQICARYDECVDEDYDVTECTSRCEDEADQSDAFADKADECETCLDDRSCAESFPCIDECIGVVP